MKKHETILALEEAMALGEYRATERMIRLIESIAYTDENGHEMVSEFKEDLIRLLRGN